MALVIAFCNVAYLTANYRQILIACIQAVGPERVEGEGSLS